MKKVSYGEGKTMKNLVFMTLAFGSIFVATVASAKDVCIIRMNATSTESSCNGSPFVNNLKNASGLLQEKLSAGFNLNDTNKVGDFLIYTLIKN